jgi:hypothetical protein
MKCLVIDNTGFDVAAMAQVKVEDFIQLHASNDAICIGQTPAQKAKWLKNAHAAIVSANKNTTPTGPTG